MQAAQGRAGGAWVAKMTVEIECLDQILDTLRELQDRVGRLEGRQAPAVVFLKEAAEMKGVSWSTLRAHPEYQPGRGKPDLVVTGKKGWHRETVEQWLRQGD